jgi:hypothetical protein
VGVLKPGFERRGGHRLVAGRARAGPDEHERPHELRPAQRERLRDVSAHRVPENVRLPDAETVQHGRGVVGELLDRPRRRIV